MPGTSRNCSLKRESSPAEIPPEWDSGKCSNDGQLPNDASLPVHWPFFAALSPLLCRAFAAFGGPVTCRHHTICALTTLPLSLRSDVWTWVLSSTALGVSC